MWSPVIIKNETFGQCFQGMMGKREDTQMEVSFKLFLPFHRKLCDNIKGIIFLEHIQPVDSSVKIFQRKLIGCYKEMIFFLCVTNNVLLYQ